MKIGIYGGSFNPCHFIHRQIVDKLLALEVFDKIIIVPTGNFYSKIDLAPFKDRLEMLKLLFNENSKIVISDYEAKEELIYSYYTLDHFQSLYPNDQVYFILGGDNFNSFDTWKRYEYILNTYNLCIINRKGVNIKDTLIKYQEYQNHLHVYEFLLPNTNSTRIRQLLNNGKYNECLNYVDEKVLVYIKKNKLYLKD